ncbi:uncharacterized protein LOC133778688 [Humulus lupulus]|uniref:uncharacterized protein LOC133778688 n=1 Tax=Humulus lupulus TaxID=3486 RepID=UPI002B402D01|nr:uncharacterized protein LOC133778688 [Humulus lupulus]
MCDFPNVSAYCQRLKILANQLKNVGAPINNSCLVLQLVAGLTDANNDVGTLIRQSKPLPPFYQARSMLTLEEADFAKKAATKTDYAMFSNASDDATSYPDTNPQNRGNGNKHNTENKNRNNNGGGRNSNKGGRSGVGGQGTNTGGGRSSSTAQQQPQRPGAPWKPWVW